MVGGAVVLFQDSVDDGFRRRRLALFGFLVTLLAEIVDVKAQHVFVFDSVGDGVGVQLFLEDVFGGFVGDDIAVNLLISGVFLKDRRAGKAEQLRLGEEFF